jgi:hypothetical protein
LAGITSNFTSILPELLFQRRATPVRIPVVQQKTKVNGLGKLHAQSSRHFGIGFTGSIFAPEYEDRVYRRRFLEGFHALIARPIQLHHEPHEYIPTQAVAEYVANVLSLDGILYASSQLGSIPETPEPKPYVDTTELTDEELALHNVVLFGAASCVVGAANSEVTNHHLPTIPEHQPAEALIGRTFRSLVFGMLISHRASVVIREFNIRCRRKGTWLGPGGLLLFIDPKPTLANLKNMFK